MKQWRIRNILPLAGNCGEAFFKLSDENGPIYTMKSGIGKEFSH
jgi:hypothetical protein